MRAFIPPYTFVADQFATDGGGRILLRAISAAVAYFRLGSVLVSWHH
jgi:hypothetical protein